MIMEKARNLALCNSLVLKKQMRLSMHCMIPWGQQSHFANTWNTDNCLHQFHVLRRFERPDITTFEFQRKILQHLIKCVIHSINNTHSLQREDSHEDLKIVQLHCCSQATTPLFSFPFHFVSQVIKYGASEVSNQIHASAWGQIYGSTKRSNGQATYNNSSKSTFSNCPAITKQEIGVLLHDFVAGLQPELAGKITGILLQMSNSDIIKLLYSPNALAAQVDRAVSSAEACK